MGTDDVRNDEVSGYEIQIAGIGDGGDRIPDLSPREAVERYLNKLRVSKRESTVSAYHYRLKHFVEWCEEEGITSISEVTGWDVESFETVRREQGIEPITLGNELKTLRNFFEYCARIELVDNNLPDRVQPPDVKPGAQVNKEQLESERARTLLNYYESNPEAYGTRSHALFALEWYTGARLGGIRGFDLENYDREERCVEFIHRPNQDTPLKNGRDGERIVGLPEHVCDIIDAYPRAPARSLRRLWPRTAVNEPTRSSQYKRHPGMDISRDGSVSALPMPTRKRPGDLRVPHLLHGERVSILAEPPPGPDRIDHVATESRRAGRTRRRTGEYVDRDPAPSLRPP